MEVLFYFVVKKLIDPVLSWAVGKTLDQLVPSLFGGKNKEIIELYERRLKQKERDIKLIKKGKDKDKQLYEDERKRIIDSLKRRSISTSKLIEKYDNSLNAVILSYATQGEIVGGKTRRLAFIKEELVKYNAKYLGGTDTLIPPSKVPSWIKDQNDLKRWFEKNILKGRYCKVKFLILFDLKKKAFWDSYVPYQQKKPKHYNIGELLSVEDLFTEEQISKISLGEIIREGDIAWLASTVLSGEELEVVLRGQNIIEKRLKRPSLRVIASGEIKNELVEALKGFISSPDVVAQSIIDEAKFWDDRLKG